MVVLNHGWPLKSQITVPRLHGQPIKLEPLGQSIFKVSQMIPVPLTLRFFAILFVLLSFAWFYVYFSGGQELLSALSCVLQDLLCLEVYSWCIHGERCTPSPPTPPPSWISPRWLQWAATGLVLDWPKSLFRFSTHSYGKTQMNFLVNSTNSRIRMWVWFQAFAYFSLQYCQSWSNNPELFFFKSSNGFHTGHIGRPGIQKKEISFDIMFTFLINRIKKKQNRLRVKSLSYTAECMRFVNRTFRHSECFYFTV